jgi:type IV pilus assembly protein PilX
MRNAASGETVAGNVRTTQLASQAAEIALRYCENAVVGMLAGTPPATAPELLDYNATPKGTNPANWDKETTDVLVIPSESVNQTGSVTFLRSPECMVERVPVVTTAGALNLSTTFMITARGFGPEVAAADASRTRPVGTEVWLQSTIELD